MCGLLRGVVEAGGVMLTVPPDPGEAEVVCDDCGGTGFSAGVLGPRPSDCPVCEGAGFVLYPDDEVEADGRVRWEQ